VRQHAVSFIAHPMKMLAHRGLLAEHMWQTYPAEPDTEGEEARTLRRRMQQPSLQASPSGPARARSC
jgi:hypothetical protein